MTQLVGGGLAQQRSNKIVLIRGRNTETLEHTKHTSPPLLIPGILRFMKKRNILISNFSHISCFRECQNNHIYIISFYKGPKSWWHSWGFSCLASNGIFNVVIVVVGGLVVGSGGGGSQGKSWWCGFCGQRPPRSRCFSHLMLNPISISSPCISVSSSTSSIAIVPRLFAVCDKSWGGRKQSWEEKKRSDNTNTRILLSCVILSLSKSWSKLLCFLSQLLYWTSSRQVVLERCRCKWQLGETD